MDWNVSWKNRRGNKYKWHFSILFIRFTCHVTFICEKINAFISGKKISECKEFCFFFFGMIMC